MLTMLELPRGKLLNNRIGRIFVNERHKKRMGIYKEETKDRVEMG